MSEKIAQVLQANLADELTARGLPSASVAGASLVQTAGSAGDPVITVGSAVAGQDYAFIRIVQTATLMKDALGNAQRAYAPTIIQVALEGTSGAPTTNSVDTLKFLSALDSACKKWGTKVDYYLSANTVVPVEGSITGTPASSSYPDPYNPLRAQT